MNKKEIITISSVILVFAIAINAGLAAHYLGKNNDTEGKQAPSSNHSLKSVKAEPQDQAHTASVEQSVPGESEDPIILEQEMVDIALQRLKEKYRLTETASAATPDPIIQKKAEINRVQPKAAPTNPMQPAIKPKNEPAKSAEPLPGQTVQTPSQPTNISSSEGLITDKQLEEAILTTLNKKNGPITKNDLEQLTSLQASNGVKSLQGIEHAGNLKSLILTGNQIKDLSPIAKLNQLQFLVLQDNQISSLSPLASLEQLKVLNLNNNQIANITPLGNLRQLTALSLSGNKAIKEISPLKGLTKLQSLYLGDNTISDISPLSGLSYLQELSLFQNRITDLTPLSGLNRLNLLDLNGNLVKSLSPLSSSQNLQSLRINRNQIQDISPLKSLSHLRELSIRENPLSEASHSDIQSLKEKGIVVEY